ncbi:MAG: hypothetical protein ACRBBK_13400 [Paracoccaceae bacterium]
MNRLILAAAALALLPLTAHSADIRLGDDSSEYANDGECDDRRFRGPGVTEEMDWADATHDATDCQSLLKAGKISLWIEADALKATQCSAIDFGSNASEYSDDGVCDDPRFEGWAAAEILSADDKNKDANDCRRLCDYGLIGLRDY